MRQSAGLLEIYAEEVEKVLMVLNSCLSHNMAWRDIQDLVDTEKSVGEQMYTR